MPSVLHAVALVAAVLPSGLRHLPPGLARETEQACPRIRFPPSGWSPGCAVRVP